MMNPVRVSAGWLSGRLFLFLLILAALVAWDAYREESLLLAALIKGSVPDKELVSRLQTARTEVARFARSATEKVNRRLHEMQVAGPVVIDKRITALQAEIKNRELLRLSTMRKAVALMTGEGLEEDLKNEVNIQLLTAERDALRRIKGEIEARRALLRNAEDDFEFKRVRTLKTWADYLAKRAELLRYIADHRFWVRVPGSGEWVRAGELRVQLKRDRQVYDAAGKDFYAARDRLAKAKALRPADVEQVRLASAEILEPLDGLIAKKRTAVIAAEKQAEKILQSIRNVFLKAFGILIAVTLVPIGIKAIWYWFVAPSVERRPPIRLRPQVVGATDAESSGVVDSPRWEKISAVSQEISIGHGEELLVHPDFLQSSANRGRKNTKLLLDWRFPLTSIAAGMTVLTRIRAATPESFVVSSKNDPFAEVGVVPLAEGTALVLQPRNLVGLVQLIGRPIRIRRRWVFSLSALITFQFRYLIFEGPGKLLVQGCRGVRLERAGSGRSIDQGSTMGFSANLDYSPKRSETFSAYMLGVNGLFNDSFAGGPGFCVYEEMPYAGKRSGITGRGLEGLTDGLMKVVGI